MINPPIEKSNRSNSTSLAEEIEQLLCQHLNSTDVPKHLAEEIEQLLYQHLYSTDVLEHLAEEIEQLLYRRLTWESDRRGQSVDFLAW